MRTEKKSITAIIFYVFAVLFLAYTAFSIFTAYEYVAGYIEQGSISYSTDFKDILALYIQQAGPYLVYSLTLYGLGYIIDIATKIKSSMDVKSVKEEASSVAFTATAPIVKETKKEVVKEAPKKETAKKEESKKEATKVEEVKKEVKKETKPKEKKPAKAKAKKEEKPAVETKEEVKEEAK